MGLSVEFDALYRRLNLTQVSRIFSGPGSTFTSSGDTNSWEFPLLATYKSPIPLIKPFLEAGPSFRHVSAFNGDSPHLSGAGFTVGAGARLGVPHFRVEPQVRYTRWGSDSKPSTSLFDPRSNVNQVELLVGISF